LNKKLVILTLTAVLLILIFFIAIQLLSTASVKQPKNGEYLPYLADYQGGVETKVFLVDSQLNYGVYNENFTRSGAAGSYSINKGDPCVIINGTIRNDYDEDYYFGITADVYNSKGEKIGPILTINSPQPGFTLEKVDSNAVGVFEIQIKYDEKDIVSYNLFIAFEPTETPPP
jgi:hypothetical protein